MDRDTESELREARLRLRESQEELQAELEHGERSSQTLDEVFFELLSRGDEVRVVVGDRTWTGVVVHAAAGLATVRTATRSEVDLSYDGLGAVQVVQRSTGPGRAMLSREPSSIVARLRALAHGDEVVEVGGPSIGPIIGVVDVVAPAHVEMTGRDGSEWVVALDQITYLLRQHE